MTGICGTIPSGVDGTSVRPFNDASGDGDLVTARVVGVPVLSPGGRTSSGPDATAAATVTVAAATAGTATDVALVSNALKRPRPSSVPATPRPPPTPGSSAGATLPASPTMGSAA